jgi:hypothetical protein
MRKIRSKKSHPVFAAARWIPGEKFLNIRRGWSRGPEGLDGRRVLAIGTVAIHTAIQADPIHADAIDVLAI